MNSHVNFQISFLGEALVAVGEIAYEFAGDLQMLLLEVNKQATLALVLLLTDGANGNLESANAHRLLETLIVMHENCIGRGKVKALFVI